MGLAPFGPNVDLSEPKRAIEPSPLWEFAFQRPSFGPSLEGRRGVPNLIRKRRPFVPSRGFCRRKSEGVGIWAVLLGFIELVQLSKHSATPDHGKLIATAG